jgi:hypothetical protein
MKKLMVLSAFFLSAASAFAQVTKTDLYDFIKKLIPDSSEYETVGDWAVGNPKKYPVKWNADKIEMSEDTSINFYRKGTAEIGINGKTLMQGSVPVKWMVMLKGPRMGYGSFSILSGNSPDIQPKSTIDSLFGKKAYKAKLLKSCDNKPMAGYYYYEVKLPKKNIAYIKFSWLAVNGSSAIRIDCYDSWSKYAVKLDCPK